MTPICSMIWTRQWNGIRQAIEEGENILIYGDYDADGMTSASIMKESLEQLDAECRVSPAQSFYRWLWSQCQCL